jgi:hypothetical protein
MAGKWCTGEQSFLLLLPNNGNEETNSYFSEKLDNLYEAV